MLTLAFDTATSVATSALVADARRPRIEPQLVRGQHCRGVVDEREYLSATRVNDRQCAGRASGQRVERRDTGRRDAERQREPARGRESDADAREAARPNADRERLDVPGMHPGLPEQRVEVLEQGHGPRRPLAEDFTVVDERARRDVSRRVESQDHHRAQS